MQGEITRGRHTWSGTSRRDKFAIALVIVRRNAKGEECVDFAIVRLAWQGETVRLRPSGVPGVPG
jgi:hypothetical protein